MALINCKECGKEISVKADRCPYCSYRPKKQSIALILSAIISVLVLIIILAFIIKSSAAVNHRSDDIKSSAASACRSFINQVLNDPDSAEYGRASEANVFKEDDGTWTVYRKVRARNAYNALRLSTFECKMKETDDGWQSLSIKEI